MSTRLRRPSVWRQLLITAALLAFQSYLGWSALNGNFGIDSDKLIKADISDLKAQSASLQAEIDSYRHRNALFNTTKLDPDILTERARALLSMAQIGDLVVMVDAKTGKPISSSQFTSTDSQLMPKIEAGID